MKSWNTNALECELCILKSQHAPKNLKLFKTLMQYTMRIGSNICDVTSNWFNQNIKSSNNVEYKIKSQTLKK